MKLRGSYRITKILKPTKAQLFKDLIVSDILYLSLGIEHQGSNRGRSYIPHIKVSTYAPEITERFMSVNELSNILRNFEVEEV